METMKNIATFQKSFSTMENIKEQVRLICSIILVSLLHFYKFLKTFLVTACNIIVQIKNLLVSFFSYKIYELLSYKPCSGSAGGAGQQPQYITSICRISFCKFFLNFYSFTKSSNTSMFDKMLNIVFLNYQFILAL